MPEVQLVGHQEFYPVSDALRLFFGVPKQTGADRLRAGTAEPLLVSRLQVPDADARPETWDARPKVRISTSLAERQIEADVPAGQARREIKRQLYRLLADWTGLDFPWGSLTGIRPTQVAAECLERTGSAVLARAELIGAWFVSPEKADLALETALAEGELLEKIPHGSLLVYLGVPFCPSRCAYCSFIAQDALHHAGLLEPYVEAVIAEARAFFRQTARPVSALYIGGGTPTSLSDRLFHRLLTGVLPEIPLLPGAELTIEAGRPDTLSPAKLELIRAAGATRLCINPQTFHDVTLARIGRRHFAADTVAAFQLARSMGFNKINMDLIAGLPGETAADFAESLRQTRDLGPDSVTVHCLAVKRSSRLHREQAQADPVGTETDRVHQPDPSLAAMLSAGYQSLKSAGLAPYYLYRQKDMVGGLENTGYARPGEGCLYNVGMMSDRRTVVGLGSGAMTKLVCGRRVERSPNPRDIADYIRRIDELAARKNALFRNGAE